MTKKTKLSLFLFVVTAMMLPTLTASTYVKETKDFVKKNPTYVVASVTGLFFFNSTVKNYLYSGVYDKIGIKAIHSKALTYKIDDSRFKQFMTFATFTALACSIIYLLTKKTNLIKGNKIKQGAIGMAIEVATLIIGLGLITQMYDKYYDVSSTEEN